MNEKSKITDKPATNPYAAPTSVAAAIPPPDDGVLPDPKPVKVVTKWLVVCTVAAAPSFYFGGGIGGWRMPEMLGMITGILIFVAGYSGIEFLPSIRSAMAQRAKRRAARIAYLSRIGISILFPIGVFVDLYCGIASVGLASVITGGEMSGLNRSAGGSGLPAFRFLTFLLTTLIQGTLLNILVFTFMAFVYGFLRIFGVKNSTVQNRNESTDGPDAGS